MRVKGGPRTGQLLSFQGTPGTTEPPLSRQTTIRGLALLLAALSFVLTYAVELRLFQLRVFHQWDVWFQTDPNYYLDVFTEPPVWFNYRHPTLPLMVYPLLDLLGRAFSLLGGSPEAARLQLALLVVPAVNALRTLILFSLFRKLLARPWPAALLCLLDIVAFATVTTGSVTESFPLSAACIAAMYWLALDDEPRPGWVRPVLWLITATIALGTTLTNVIPLFVLLIASVARRGARLRDGLREIVPVAGVIGVALAVTGLLALAGGAFYGYPVSIRESLKDKRFYHPPAGEVTTELAWAVAHTFVAPRPGIEPTWADRAQNPDFDFLFSYAPPYEHGRASLWRAALTVGMLLTGAAGFAWRRATAAWLLAPAAILALNYAMHLFYGDHYLLYALHWETSLLFVLAGVALLPFRGRTAATAGLLVFTAVTAVNSWIVLDWLFAQLAAALTRL